MNSKRFDDLVHEIKATEFQVQNAQNLMAQMQDARATEDWDASDSPAIRIYAIAERDAIQARQSNLDARRALIYVLNEVPATYHSNMR